MTNGPPLLHRLRSLRRRVSAAAYIDIDRRVETSLLVASSGRSGSTWVAEVLNHDNSYRLVFEPFRRDVVREARPLRYGQYIAPDELDHPLAARIEKLLAGRVRGAWVDGYNLRRLARRRIVKEIRVTNLLPWIHARFPELPIVYILRDPVAVARSWHTLGWGDVLDEFLAQDELLEQFPAARSAIESISRDRAPMARHLLRWCLENTIPLRSLSSADTVHVVTYERLRSDPHAGFGCLFRAVGRQYDAAAAAAVSRRSATADYPRRRAADDDPTWVPLARELTEVFGISRLLDGAWAASAS